MGIGTGPFSAWPGVGGVFWLARTVYVRPAASYSVATRTCGVPACPYLRRRSQGRLGLAVIVSMGDAQRRQSARQHSHCL